MVKFKTMKEAIEYMKKNKKKIIIIDEAGTADLRYGKDKCNLEIIRIINRMRNNPWNKNDAAIVCSGKQMGMSTCGASIGSLKSEKVSK